MKVAVVQGGPSTEAEVSRRSAAGVASALRSAGHTVDQIELAPVLARELLVGNHDVVFPVVHGRHGEDGALQGLLEVLGLPYVGSCVLACALAADKVQAKHLFRMHNLPVAEQVVLRVDDDRDASIRALREQFALGVAVKPASQGSAIGVSLVRDLGETSALHHALEEAFRYDEVVLCERLVVGREVTCGVIDTPSLGSFRALPVTEIFSHASSWYDFRSKYATGGSVHECPASLPSSVFERVQSIACAAHRALGCRDFSRVDFVVGDGSDADAVTLLEVNVIPGMTATSLYPEAVAATGIEFSALCDGLVRGAVERWRSHSVEARPMPD